MARVIFGTRRLVKHGYALEDAKIAASFDGLFVTLGASLRHHMDAVPIPKTVYFDIEHGGWAFCSLYALLFPLSVLE